MRIEISQKNFGTLCICALRYCHGRRSYMPSLVQRIVREHFEDLSAGDLKVIAEDEQFQAQFNLWGDSCDLSDWQRFYRYLEKCRATK